MGDRPLGRIFLFEGHDLVVQPDVAAAESFIEPYDADTGEIYDELGHRLHARVIGEKWPKRIELSVADAEPRLTLLVNRVRAFMEASGEAQPQHDDPAEWLREASTALLRRQRSDTPWGRLRRRFLGKR